MQQPALQAMQVTVFSHESVEYYTPAWVIEAARSILGTIDLDPASCKIAQLTVKAKAYYTKEDNGFDQEWRGRVWLNPPYSKSKISNKSNQQLWSQRLAQDYRVGKVTEAILLVKAAVGYKWFEALWDEFPVCFLRKRLSFARPDGSSDGQSKQGTAIFYMGNRLPAFTQVFSRHGRVIMAEGKLYRQQSFL